MDWIVIRCFDYCDLCKSILANNFKQLCSDTHNADDNGLCVKSSMASLHYLEEDDGKYIWISMYILLVMCYVCQEQLRPSIGKLSPFPLSSFYLARALVEILILRTNRTDDVSFLAGRLYVTREYKKEVSVSLFLSFRLFCAKR